jgi:hypothetical protein
MSTKQLALDRLVFRVNEMDITEQLNWLGDAIMPVEARRELAEVRAENDALRARVRQAEILLETAKKALKPLSDWHINSLNEETETDLESSMDADDGMAASDWLSDYRQYLKGGEK